MNSGITQILACCHGVSVTDHGWLIDNLQLTDVLFFFSPFHISCHFSPPRIKSEPDGEDFYHSPKSLKRERDDDE